jgi:hypothetical protein
LIVHQQNLGGLFALKHNLLLALIFLKPLLLDIVGAKKH